MNENDYITNPANPIDTEKTHVIHNYVTLSYKAKLSYKTNM
jgi:hypothetical protein